MHHPSPRQILGYRVRRKTFQLAVAPAKNSVSGAEPDGTGAILKNGADRGGNRIRGKRMPEFASFANENAVVARANPQTVLTVRKDCEHITW
jgi:hypothetical protein